MIMIIACILIEVTVTFTPAVRRTDGPAIAMGSVPHTGTVTLSYSKADYSVNAGNNNGKQRD